MSDYWSILEQLVLPLVKKPGRYVGEFTVGCDESLSAGRKPGLLLAFPDTCEVGASNLGIRILASAASRTAGVLVDFCFAPWPDFEAELRKRKIPLCSLCHSIPLSQFDVVGFSLQYELQYANVLNMLELGGIPLHAADRGSAHPLVVAGGVCAYNPEPMSDFFDCFSVGDGEETIGPICREVVSWRRQGGTRRHLLERLSERRGIYVPSLYGVRTLEDGTEVREVSERGPVRPALARDIENAEPALFLPRVEVTHDRLNVEVMRGCTRGCRFCMAGYVYRPVREKSAQSVFREVERGISRTGYEELSLVSLSTPDYSHLTRLLPALGSLLSARGVEVTLPSMRPDTLTSELVRNLERFKKSGLTLAPEAGTRRLRDVINKGMDDEEILEAVERLASTGWNMMKLYFMVGLPTETDGDVEAIPLLVEKALRRARRRNPRVTFNVSVSAFTPKPHTPFQWEAQLSVEEMTSRTRRVAAGMRRLPVKVRWRDAGVSFLEGVLARSDRRACAPVKLAFDRGARLDAWSDFFRLATWLEAFRDSGLDVDKYAAERPLELRLPWDHVEVVSKDVLVGERFRAREGRLTEDCRTGPCYDCGVLGGTGRTPAEMCFVGAVDSAGPEEGPEQLPVPEVRSVTAKERLTGGKYRFQYDKKGRARFLSHLDLVRVFTRALRASGLPVAYSEGFRKRPRVSFGPPLPLGFTSSSEYLDLELSSAPEKDPASELNRFMPDGVRITEWKRLEPGTGSLSSSCTTASYSVVFPEHLIAGTGMDVDSFRGELLAGLGRYDPSHHVIVSREGSPKVRDVVLGSAVKELEPLGGGQIGLRMVLSLAGPDVLRPDDVAGALLRSVRFEKKYLQVERNAVYLARPAGAAVTTPM